MTATQRLYMPSTMAPRANFKVAAGTVRLIRFRFKSLRSALLFYFVLFITLTMVLVGVASYVYFANKLEQSTVRSLENQLRLKGEAVNAKFYSLLNSLIAISQQANTASLDSVVLHNKLSVTPEDYLHLSSSIENLRYQNFDVIDSIYVDFRYGSQSFLVYSGDSYPTPKGGLSWFTSTAALTAPLSGIGWLNLHADPLFHRHSQVLSLFAKVGTLRSKSPSPTLVGETIMNIRASYLQGMLGSAVSAHGYFVLVSPHGAMTAANVAANLRLSASALAHVRTAHQTMGETVVGQGFHRLYVMYDTLPINGWKLVAVVPQTDIVKQIGFLRLLIVVFLAVLTSAMVLMSFIVTSFVTRPLANLTRQVVRASAGELTLTSAPAREDEIGVLHRATSGFMDRIKELIAQVRQEEQVKRKLELRMMQAQINPHFLYNSLYSVQQLCDLGDGANASEMVNALSEYYRLVLSQGREVITIQEELNQLESYLFIQKMRYGDELSYVLSVHPAVLKCEMVKLSLQPLVENAIYHGLKPKGGAGCICVRGYRHDGDVMMEVEDTGIGLSAAAARTLQHSFAGAGGHDPTFAAGHAAAQGDGEDERDRLQVAGTVGFGLTNVHQRLRLHFGDGYGLRILPGTMGGTLVRVRIPMQSIDDSHASP